MLNVRAVFRVAKAMVSDVIDLFGTEVTFSDEDDTGVTVSAFTNEMAMEQFAMSFVPDVLSSVCFVRYVTTFVPLQVLSG